jgi:stress response protein SCP2
VSAAALTKGGNAGLDAGLTDVVLSAYCDSGHVLDVSGLLLGADGKVRSDADFIFYNAPSSADGSLTWSAQGITARLPAIPAEIDRIAITVSADGAAFREVFGLRIVLASQGSDILRFDVPAAADETAVLLGELYRRGGGWKFRAVGQGWASGLAGLATDFGISVDDEPAAPNSGAASVPTVLVPAQASRSIDMEKKVAEQAPQLLNLVKAARISLEKRSLADETARVALVLDVSASMAELFSTGAVQAFAERALALALQWDDDGEVDVFTVGAAARSLGGMGLANARDFLGTAGMTLEGGTNWGSTMAAVRQHYFGTAGPRSSPAPPEAPVYVLFVTDGGTTDPQQTIEQLVASSFEPLFWQMLIVGTVEMQVRSVMEANFGPGSPNAAIASRIPEAQKLTIVRQAVDNSMATLRSIDNVSGRYLDNHGFAEAPTPEALPDEALYDALLERYAGWLKQARSQGLVTG